MTDSDGRLVLATGEEASFVRAVASGYAEGLASVDVDSDVVVVELDPGWTIRGRVMWPWGAPAAGVDVISWASSTPFERLHMKAHIDHGPTDGRDSTRTDPRGHFELAGMLHGEAYSVAAGADGAVTTDALFGITQALVPVELTIDPLFGVIVELEECHSRSRVDPRIHHRLASRPSDPGLESVLWNHNRPHLPLSGIEELFATTMLEDGQRLMLYKGTRERAGGITARIFADVWGYEETHFDVPVADLHEAGRIWTETLCLTPSAAGRGTLRLNLTGPLVSEGPSGCFEYNPAGFLCVASLEDESSRRRIPVRAPLERGLEVPGVPAGRHEVWLEMGGFKRRYPTDDTRVPVLVKAGSTHELSFDVSGVGMLEVEVRTPDGDVYTGDIALRLERLFRRGHYFKRFHCAPYRFPALEPGDYEVDLQRIAISPGIPESRQTTATVVVDETSRAVLQL